MLDKTTLESKAKAVQERLGLSAKDVGQLQGEAHGLYEDIAPDLEPDNKRRKTCKRATIIEIVLDAGRLAEKFRHGSSESDIAITRALASLKYEELIDLVGPAFPYADYEVGSY